VRFNARQVQGILRPSGNPEEAELNIMHRILKMSLYKIDHSYGPHAGAIQFLTIGVLRIGTGTVFTGEGCFKCSNPTP
jgi:hypothetical protein